MLVLFRKAQLYKRGEIRSTGNLKKSNITKTEQHVVGSPLLGIFNQI